MSGYHPSHRPGSRPTFTSSPDRTIDVGYVHVGKPVSQRAIEGVWECADDCPHPDHATPSGRGVRVENEAGDGQQ